MVFACVVLDDHGPPLACHPAVIHTLFFAIVQLGTHKCRDISVISVLAAMSHVPVSLGFRVSCGHRHWVLWQMPVMLGSEGQG